MIIIKVEVIKKLADEWDDEEDGDELVKLLFRFYFITVVCREKRFCLSLY